MIFVGIIRQNKFSARPIVVKMSFFTPSQAAIAAVRNKLSKPIEDVDDFMDFVSSISYCSEITQHLEIEKSLIRARAQRELFQMMFHFTQCLRTGLLKGSGLAGKAIVGAKGIGKSTAAKTFVSVVEAVFPDVIGVFLNMQAAEGEMSQLSTITLFGALREFLILKRNMTFEDVDKFTSPEEGFMRTLRERNQHIFLFVDELDEFYKNDPKSIFVQTLQQLQLLGSSNKGRIATILCGSSAYFTDLITSNRTDIMKARFPLLGAGVPDLNASKFRTERIHSNLPTDLVTVERILELVVPHPPLDDDRARRRARSLAFFAGSTIRTIQQVLTTSSVVSDRTLYSETFNSFGLTPSSKLLFQGILDKLLQVNADLIEIFVDEATFIEKTASVEWESRLCPITYQDAEIIWEAIPQKQFSDEDKTLPSQLLNLSDTSWIILDGVYNSSPRYIYPKTLYLLLETKMGHRLHPSIKHRLIEFVKDGDVG